MNLKTYLETEFHKILSELSIDAPAIIKQAARPEFGHYQANGIMGAAKKAGLNPRELAEKVVSGLNIEGVDRVEVAGPGFINIHLDNDFLVKQLQDARSSARLSIEPHKKQKIVVDYSSPNLAKEMHVGHLRPTTIGDALVRILEFFDQEVIRANHVGDWGAQFGSLLAYMDQISASEDKLHTELKDLEKFYQAASKLFKSDPEFAKKAREFVVRLQSGDEKCLRLWQQFIDESIDHCQNLYALFNITLKVEDIKPESFYNDDLPILVEDLNQKGLLVESDGARCVFLDEFKGKDDKPLPAIIQKSDGGYPYMATDLAAVRYRANSLKVDQAIYVVGAEQQLHLRQVFAVSKAAGYFTDTQVFKHYPFGKVLKKDGTPFKTRDGADVKLIDVVNEAKDRAHKLVSDKNPDLDEETRLKVADAVGTGALKYAELSKNRMTDYIFDWDTMLSFEGNTAPYLQYAYTRIQSIFRREGIEASSLKGALLLKDTHEQALAMKLLQISEALDTVLEDCHPNLLCNYLYELSGIFMSFYEACPVLKAEAEIKTSRLILCDLTARTLKLGLDLLGIETVDQM